MRLTVPTPYDNPFERVITNPAVLIEWLDHLPHIDQEGRLAEITEALSHLIRHPDSVSQLPQLLHCYQDAFDELYEQFIAGRRTNPNRATGRKAISLLNLLHKFNREMGFGYNRLLNEFSNSFQRDRLINSITHAMLTHERDILFAFEGYRSVTPIARQALAQLYQFAESRELADAITDISPASACDILKRVLLLTLADPYILPQHGIWSAHSYLKKYAPMATLKMESNGGILVDIQSSSIRTTQGKMVAQTENANRYRYIDTRLLCEATRRYVAQAIQDASKLPDALNEMDRNIAIQLLRRWHTNWSVPPERKATREEKYNRIKFTCGIDAIYHYLQQGSLTEREPIENTYEEEVVLEGSDIYLTSDQLNEHPIHEWQMINLSESGAGLTDDECVSACLHQVGQLVLLAAHNLSDYKKPWVTGIIRRRLEEGMHKNEIGIQFINGNLHPLEINPLISEADDPPDFSPAFVVNREKGVPLILAMRGLFKPNRAFNLRKEEQRRRIRAVNLIESTRYFDLFSFTTNDE